MLWRRTAPPLTVPPVAPVPDAEALRLALLQASWRRGRWVARRRLALRWLLWATTRYLMPATLVFGLAAWLWLGVLPSVGNPWLQLAPWTGRSVQPERPTPAPPTALVTPPLTPAVAPDEALEYETAYVEFSPEGEEIPRPLALKFEARWAGAGQRLGRGTVPAPASEPVPNPQPTLKPENWLHSKEP